MATNATPTAVPVRAADVCQRFKPSDSARQILGEEMSPKDYIAALAEAKLHADAIQFIAQYLPKRQAVWWACQCIHKGTADKLTPEESAAMKAAEDWVAQPSEQARMVAMQAADDADGATAAGCIALAAYWSEAPPQQDLKSQMRMDAMCGKLAGAAILLAAVVDAAKAQTNLADFVTDGAAVITKTYGQR